MYCGHSPNEIADYRLADVRLFANALPDVIDIMNPGLISYE